MWTYVLNYTCKYVQYTYNIRLRSYCIRTRRITYVHVRIRTYTHVYARIWLQRSRMLGWPEPYVNVFPMNTCRYWHPAGDTDCTYMNVYVRICNYTCIYVQHIHARICNYTCIYVQHVYARIFDRNTVRIFARNTCTCKRLRCCHGCFAFTGAGASLCTFAARLLRQVCRATAQAHADRQIQSYQVCATDQRKLAATCTGVPRTTELRRRWPTAETLILGFLDPTAPKSKHRKSTQTFMVLLKQSENGMT